jgi:hypothetical protein
LRFPWLALSIDPMRIRRDSAWLLAALLFAAAALPLLVYFTGLQTFGPYAHGGPLDFFRDYYADLARLRPAAWLLLLGPVIMVLLWRVIVAYAWPEGGQ